MVESFGRHVQCVLNFEENWSEDGGTLIVPCFHRYLSQWVVDQASLRKNIPWVTLPPDEQQRLLQHAHRICMQPGSVLIWDQRVMHGTQRNHSSRCRMAQYLKAYPRSSTFPSINGSPHPRLVRRAEGIRRELEKSGDISRISELGWHLFGLDCITEYERACNDQTVS